MLDRQKEFQQAYSNPITINPTSMAPNDDVLLAHAIGIGADLKKNTKIFFVYQDKPVVIQLTHTLRPEKNKYIVVSNIAKSSKSSGTITIDDAGKAVYQGKKEIKIKTVITKFFTSSDSVKSTGSKSSGKKSDVYLDNYDENKNKQKDSEYLKILSEEILSGIIALDIAAKKIRFKLSKLTTNNNLITLQNMINGFIQQTQLVAQGRFNVNDKESIYNLISEKDNLDLEFKKIKEFYNTNFKLNKDINIGLQTEINLEKEKLDSLLIKLKEVDKEAVGEQYKTLLVTVSNFINDQITALNIIQQTDPAKQAELFPKFQANFSIEDLVREASLEVLNDEMVNDTHSTESASKYENNKINAENTAANIYSQYGKNVVAILVAEYYSATKKLSQQNNVLGADQVFYPLASPAKSIFSAPTSPQPKKKTEKVEPSRELDFSPSHHGSKRSK